MGLATLLFFLYVILVPLGLVLLGMGLMRYLNRLPYPPEKRIMFTAIAIACLTIIAFSIGAKLNQLRTPTPPEASPVQSAPIGPLLPENTADTLPSPHTSHTLQNTKKPVQEHRVPDDLADSTSTLVIGTQENIAPAAALNYEELLEMFEQNNYPELYEQRMRLLEEIDNQYNTLQRLRRLAQQTPKQRSLLIEIYRIRKLNYDRLQQRNITVSQELRDFWVHYNTGDSSDATKKFNRVSPRLNQSIKQTLSQMLDSEQREEQVINKHLRRAGQALKSHKIPAQQAGKITSYKQQNRAFIVDWLNQQDDSRTLEALTRLLDERSLIQARYQQVGAFQKRYPDLKNRLARTLQLWANAREANYYAEYRLLFAAEARFIIDHMQLRSGQSAARDLAQTTRSYTQFVIDHAEETFQQAEEAYKPSQLR